MAQVGVAHPARAQAVAAPLAAVERAARAVGAGQATEVGGPARPDFLPAVVEATKLPVVEVAKFDLYLRTSTV